LAVTTEKFKLGKNIKKSISICEPI
jgi:hypothetical protein